MKKQEIKNMLEQKERLRLLYGDWSMQENDGDVSPVQLKDGWGIGVRDGNSFRPLTKREAEIISDIINKH